MRLDELNIPTSKNRAGQTLQAAGYEPLGTGQFAEVYKKPGTNYVLKLFDHDDKAYLLYLGMIRKHQDNPHFPKIIGKLIKVTDQYYAVRMEELQPTSISDRLLKIMERFCERRADFWIGNWDAFMKSNFSSSVREELETLFKQNPKLPEALTAIAELKADHSLWFDFKRANVMERPNGTVVFTDPIV